MINDLSTMSHEQLISLLNQYRELVACAWARSIPHEGTDEADCDWCEWYKEGAPWQEFDSTPDPAAFHDKVVLDFFGGDHSEVRKHGWTLFEDVGQ